MSDLSYEQLLKTSWDGVPVQKTLPDGSYRLRGRSAKLQAPKKEGNSPRILFVYGVQEAMSDVDEAALDALGPNYDMDMNAIFSDFWVGNNVELDRVRKHLEKHGIETKGKDLPDTLKEFKGTEIIARITTEMQGGVAGSQEPKNVALAFHAIE